jgi:hypothetical protein
MLALEAGDDRTGRASNEPPFRARFSEKIGHPDFKKAGKARRCCLTLASRVRSRSAFASSVRPSASSASAVTRALSLVQACFRPKAVVGGQ